MIRFAVLGLGEAGSALAVDLVAAGVDVHGFDPGDVATPPGVTRHADAASAVGDAELVIAVTAAANAEAALVQALPAVAPGTVYADLSTGSPGLKRRLDEAAAAAGVGFADVALMAPVPGRGLQTPAVASGRAAARFVEIVRPLGMPVEHDGDVAGQAATRKLLRSIVMKGLAGVLRESMEAARRAGLADETWSNVVDQLSNADESLLRRLAEGPAAHAGRRVEEMEAAEQLLVELGVEPTMTRATVASLRRLAGRQFRVFGIVGATNVANHAKEFKPGLRLGCAEGVQPPGVAHQQLPARRLVGGEGGDEVEQIAVVGHVRDVRVRPVGTPQHAVGSGLDQRPGERHHVVIRRTAGAEPLGAGELDPAAVVAEQHEERAERRLVEAAADRDAPHVVEDVRHREAGEHLGVIDEIGGIDVQHKVPAEPGDALHHRPEALGLGRPAEMLDEVEASAPDAGVVELAELVVAERLVDHRHAGIATASVAESVEHRRVVGAVAARLHENGVLQAEALL